VLETRVEEDGEGLSAFMTTIGAEFVAETSTRGIGTSLSAGCLAGSTGGGLLILASISGSSTPPTYPISPRFDGKGPACGRAGSDSDEVSVDAIIPVCLLTMEGKRKLAPGKVRGNGPLRRKEKRMCSGLSCFLQVANDLKECRVGRGGGCR